jgi:cell division septal protein FtsQ
MKKLYRIVLFFITFIFLTTYSPNHFYSTLEKDDTFFKIKNIIITNNFLIEEKKIINKLQKIYDKNIFFIKRRDIEEPLREINFLKNIEVKKKYPSTVIVKIFETKPVAILFKNQNKYLIDDSSNLIQFDKTMNTDDFSSVFGKGAENNFMYFYNQLKDNKFPIKEIKTYYFFQINRWDLELFKKTTIKFPYNNIEDAIRKSIELINRKDFKNYKVIDLRVNGKIIVE